MSNPFLPPVVPSDDDDDDRVDAPDILAGDADEDRPLDLDLDADSIESAAADERAATAGTVDGEGVEERAGDGAGQGDVVDDRP